VHHLRKRRGVREDMGEISQQSSESDEHKGSHGFDRYQVVVFLFHTCVRSFCRVTIYGGEKGGFYVQPFR